MTDPVRVGTRRSPLAQAQTDEVLRSLAFRFPEHRFEPVPIATAGDRRRSPSEPPDFTDAIDRALETREIDLAVHSAKDLPARPTRAVALVAVPPRADARDAVVLRSASSLAELPSGARLGSSSLRRRAQIKTHRPDLEVVEIHGNIGTRLEKMVDAGLDGVVLAVAGLSRLGWADRITETLPLEEWIPAPGQGALAVEARTDDRAMREVASAVDHPESRTALRAEAAFSAALGGDCNLPLAAFARVRGGTIELTGEVFAEDGSDRRRSRAEGPKDDPEKLGRRAAERLERYSERLDARIR